MNTDSSNNHSSYPQTIVASNNETASLPFDTAPFPTGNVYIDSILWGGHRWSVGSNRVLTYSFWGPGSEHFDDQGENFCSQAYPWLNHEIASVEAALQTWSNVANISFVRASDNDPDATLGFYSVTCDQIDALGMCGTPDSNPSAGIAYLAWDWGSSQGWDFGLQPGGGAFATIVHELGHGLGLAHPHDDGGGSTLFPGVTYGDDSDMGTDKLNQGIWTTMSYIDGWQAQDGLTTTSSFGLQATPMAFDIAAIQYLYGRNTTYHAGNDAYVLPFANDLGTCYSCIWDAGGTDVLMAGSTYADVTIDLRDAPLFGENAGGYVSQIKGVYGGFTIANGAVIENAIGGFGNDSLTGNSVSNILTGQAGNDALTGWGGNDVLVGGAGRDRLDGYATAGREFDTLKGGAGSDTFILGGTWGVSYRGAGYAVIRDWNAAQDWIEVTGSSTQYKLSKGKWIGGSALDVAIWYGNDCIGIIQDRTNIVIARDFKFV